MAVCVDFQMVGRVVDGLEDDGAVFEFERRVGCGDGVAIENQTSGAWILDDIAVAEVDPLWIVMPWAGLDLRDDGVFGLEMDLEAIGVEECERNGERGGFMRRLQFIGCDGVGLFEFAFAVLQAEGAAGLEERRIVQRDFETMMACVSVSNSIWKPLVQNAEGKIGFKVDVWKGRWRLCSVVDDGRLFACLNENAAQQAASQAEFLAGQGWIARRRSMVLPVKAVRASMMTMQQTTVTMET